MNTRRIHTGLLIILVSTILIGCSSDDSPTAPGGGTIDLAEIFPESEAIITSDSDDIKLRMVGVRFHSNTDDLTADSKPILDKFQEVFQHFGNVTYSVEGHTASNGSQSYNQTLSLNQAQAVKKYFDDELNGTAQDIEAIGFGETIPIEDNATAAGRAINRRIEVIIHFSE